MTMIPRMTNVDSCPVRPSSNRPPRAAGQARDDTGKYDERNAVADAARGNLLAQPHEEHCAAREGDHRAGAKEQARIQNHVTLALKADRDAIGLQRGQNTVP